MQAESYGDLRCGAPAPVANRAPMVDLLSHLLTVMHDLSLACI